MSIGEHQHPSFFQNIQLNNLFLLSQNFSVNILPNQQAAGTVYVFQFADFDGLNIYFGYVDFTTNTFTVPTTITLPNSNIISKSTLKARDNMFGIYKGVTDNELDFDNQTIYVGVKPNLFSTSGGTAI
jgi:hypothetical protein